MERDTGNTPSADKENRKRRQRLVDKDAPETTREAGTKSVRPEDERYLPDENVDNQKGRKSPPPEHNTSRKMTPYRGAQIGEQKQRKKNINKASDEAKSSRRNG